MVFNRLFGYVKMLHVKNKSDHWIDRFFLSLAMALGREDADGFGRGKRPRKIGNEITPLHLQTLTAGAAFSVHYCSHLINN